MQSSGGAHFSLHKQINLSSPGLTEGVQYDIIKAILFDYFVTNVNSMSK